MPTSDPLAPRRLTYRTLDLPLVAREWGPPDGPPVVLLHGFLDQGMSFAPIARRLAHRHRVIVPDHRGHGDSGHVGPGGYYHFPDYVLDLDALWRAAGLDRAALVGHSMGGSIASYFAGAFPERVSRLVLLEGLGPTASPAEGAPDRVRRWVEEVVRRDRHAPPGVADLPGVARRLKKLSPHMDDALALELAPHASAPGADDLFRWKFDPLHRTTAPMPFDPDRFAHFLRRVQCPALVVWGELTPLKPADADTRAAQLPDARVVTVPGAAHNLHHEQPERVAALLDDFLAA